MLISRKMAEAVQGGCRPVRHDALVGSALPGKSAGRELQPGFPQREMVRNRRAGQVIDTVGGALQDGPVRAQSVTSMPQARARCIGRIQPWLPASLWCTSATSAPGWRW